MHPPGGTNLVDLDLDRLGLWALFDTHFEYTVSIRRANAVAAGVERKPEYASHCAVVPLRYMNLRLLRPLGTLALGRNYQPIVLHLHIDRVILEPGHLDVEMVGIFVLDHIRRG